MAFIEDLGEFFSSADFAVDALWAGSTVQVVFESPYSEFEGVASRTSHCWVRDAQVPGISNTQTLQIGSTLYKIMGIEPDGTGVSLVRLSR